MLQLALTSLLFLVMVIPAGMYLYLSLIHI